MDYKKILCHVRCRKLNLLEIKNKVRENDIDVLRFFFGILEICHVLRQ